jgi:hypothetical protein
MRGRDGQAIQATLPAPAPSPSTALSAAVAAVALYLAEEQAASGRGPSRWREAARREAVVPFDRHVEGRANGQ